MTAAEGSFIGLAKQTAKGTPNVTDAEFKYLLFNEGGMAVNSLVRPLDPEVGGGALLRSMAKLGYTSGGAMTFVPRPTTIGHLLMGALGTASAPANNADGSYTHTFTLGSDQFAAPYYTMRATPGGLWGETFQDTRVASLALSWRGADFLRGQVGFMGGLATPNVSMAGWGALAKVDGGPQFLAPITTVELPAASTTKVLSGALVMGLNIPLDEQWITGAYMPDDFEINQRTIALSLVLKISDVTLFEKMTYDPAGTATGWVPEIFKEADITLTFLSDQDAGSTPTPYEINVLANGETGTNANVFWSCQPIALRAGRQVTMAVTGLFAADPTAGEPITVELTNTQSTQY